MATHGFVSGLAVALGSEQRKGVELESQLLTLVVKKKEVTKVNFLVYPDITSITEANWLSRVLPKLMFWLSVLAEG